MCTIAGSIQRWDTEQPTDSGILGGFWAGLDAFPEGFKPFQPIHKLVPTRSDLGRHLARRSPRFPSLD